MSGYECRICFLSNKILFLDSENKIQSLATNNHSFVLTDCMHDSIFLMVSNKQTKMEQWMFRL